MVRHVSNRVAVMYLGKVVELADAGRLYRQPSHPMPPLLSAVPVADPDLAAKRERVILQGDVPSPIDPPSGCRFHPRCPKAQQLCVDEIPPLTAKESGDLAVLPLPGPAGREPGPGPSGDPSGVDRAHPGDLTGGRVRGLAGRQRRPGAVRSSSLAASSTLRSKTSASSSARPSSNGSNGDGSGGPGGSSIPVSLA